MKRKNISMGLAFSLICMALAVLPLRAQEGGSVVLTTVVPERPEESIQASRDAEKLSDIPLPEGWEWKDGDTPLKPGESTTGTAVYKDESGNILDEREVTISMPGETDPVQTESPSETEKPIETESPSETEKPAETESPSVTEKPADTRYPAVSGGGSTWDGTQKQGISISVPEELGEIVSVTVDGRTLDPGDYTITGDPVAVALTPEYLSTLEEGEHTILIQGADGYVEETFTVIIETREEESPVATKPGRDTRYPAVSGGGSTWDGTQKQGISISVPEELGEIVSVTVDGRTLDPGDYTITGDPVAVALTPEYLSTLEEGEHTILIQGTDGYVEENFTVIIETRVGEPPVATESEEPTETESPAQTEEPTETESPAQTEEPTETESPAQTEEPTETESPAQTEEPTETESPAQTEEPTETESPAQTEEPTETESPAQTEEPDAGGQNNGVKTGDETNLLPWITAMLLSMGILSAAGYRRQKDRKK